jgi:hypothetical protein
MARKKAVKIYYFLFRISIGSYTTDEIFDLAEDISTDTKILKYLADHGTNLLGFKGYNFSSIAELTLWRKNYS